jgi:hypothetical protein
MATHPGVEHIFAARITISPVYHVAMQGTHLD